MKRVGNFIILIGLTVGYCGPLYAQKPAERTFPSISEQQLPRFDASKVRGDFAAAPAGAKDQAYSPFDVVVQFLQLNSTQAQQFQQLLTARQKALEPLIQQITALNTIQFTGVAMPYLSVVCRASMRRRISSAFRPMVSG